MVSYKTLREQISANQHEAWSYWSKTIAKELHEIKVLCYTGKTTEAIQKINARINRWEKNWKPYNKLSEDAKEMDREWADKILDSLPIRCPISQCGSFLIPTERKLPKDFIESEHYNGDEQTPDLICKDCGGIYRFTGFKVKKHRYV